MPHSVWLQNGLAAYDHLQKEALRAKRQSGNMVIPEMPHVHKYGFCKTTCFNNLVCVKLRPFQQHCRQLNPTKLSVLPHGHYAASDIHKTRLLCRSGLGASNLFNQSTGIAGPHCLGPTGSGPNGRRTRGLGPKEVGPRGLHLAHAGLTGLVCLGAFYNYCAPRRRP